MLRAQFVVHFDASIANLQGAEQITRRELAALSRDLLTAIHGFKDEHLSRDIQFINKTLTVLTPVNRKVAVLFFTHFAGFHMDDGTKMFTKKSAKRYAEAKAASVELLADPNQNIWTWADRHIEVEAKPLDVKKVRTYMEGVLKKAGKDNVPRLDILEAVFDAGFTAAELMALMDKVNKVQAEKLAAVAHLNVPAPM